MLVACQTEQTNVDPNSSPEFFRAHQFCKSIGVDDTRDPDGIVNARMGECMIDTGTGEKPERAAISEGVREPAARFGETPDVQSYRKARKIAGKEI